MKLLRSLLVATLVLCGAPAPEHHGGLALAIQSAHAGLIVQSGPKLHVAPQGGGETPDTVEEDYLYRIGQFGSNPNAGGVVWHHNFETVSEVDAFRWSGDGTGNDPDDESTDRSGTVRFIEGDGLSSGNSLEIWRAAGGQDPSNWWRPLCALTGASNGRGEDDPGANGTLTPRTFIATQGGDETADWDDCYYGDADYHASYPGQFDGTEYWIQARIKMDPNRIEGTNDNGGKFFYFTRTNNSATDQEIVLVSGNSRDSPERNVLDVYRSINGSVGDQDSPGVAVHGNQPGIQGGAVGDGVCRYDDNGGRLDNCYFWPEGEWTTFLFHIVPGTADFVGGGSEGNNDTLLEIFVAEYGETSYRQIWSQSGLDLPFDHVPGHNALIASAYMNGSLLDIDTPFYHRIGELIFSQEWIPPPQVYDDVTPLEALAYSLVSGESATLSTTWTGGDIPDGDSLNWISSWYLDAQRKVGFSATKRQTANDAMEHQWYRWDTNTWLSENAGFDEAGHVWDFIGYNPETGHGFIGPGGGRQWLYNSTWTPGTSLSAPAQFGPVNPATTIGAIDGPSGFVAGASSMAWHPDLYGAGDDGLVILCEVGIAGYRFSTNTYSIILDGYPPSDDDMETSSQCAYSARWGAVICSTYDGTRLVAIHNSTTLVHSGGAELDHPPVIFSTDRDEEDDRARLFDDPTGQGGPYALEVRSVGGGFVYRLGDDGTWNLQSYTHPITAPDTQSGLGTVGENWLVAEGKPMNVFVALEWQSGAAPRMRVWRPFH